MIREWKERESIPDIDKKVLGEGGHTEVNKGLKGDGGHT